MSLKVRWAAGALGILGIITTLVLHWMVFFWVPTERTMGVVQRIFYIHVPAAWVAFMAFGIVAICSAIYLWLQDERLDMAAKAAAEGGMLYTTIVLLTGPLWGRVAWGTWWTWEPRLTLTLLLWFIYLGYFLVRASTENPEKGKRFAAVVGIIFVIFHVSLFRIVPTAWLGFVLAWVVLFGGSIYPAMLWHALNNAIVIVPSGLGWFSEDFTPEAWWAFPASVALGFSLWILWKTGPRK